ncbi:HTH-type transcriptional repressor NicR [Alcanivorax sp. ALC70]|nr:HTH-type transcriptional repressor NicR [Alcanivorax sp. ALC70]
MIKRLKARDWIALSTCAQDQRKVIVTITPEGEGLVDEMVPAAQRISDLTMENLNPAERVALLHLLAKMSGPRRRRLAPPVGAAQVVAQTHEPGRHQG